MFRLLIVSLLVSLVSCKSAPEKRATPYDIARPSNWETINLAGSGKKLTGFSDDLLYEIAQIEQFSVRIHPVDRDLAFSQLNQGTVDGILTGLIPDEQNRQYYHFSEPYFVTGPVLLVRINSPYQNLQDLTGREIGFSRLYSWALKSQDTVGPIFRPYDDLERSLDDLKTGHIDGLILDAVTAYSTVSGPYRYSLRIASKPLLTMGVRLVVKAGGKAEELIPLFNKGLEEVKKAGLYPKMLRYWGLFDATNPASAYTESPSEF